MAGTYTQSYTPTTGDTITVARWNSAWNDHNGGCDFTGLGDYSASASEMQTTTDPYPAAAESLATDGKGELERLRYVVKQLSGEAQWYIDPDTDITTLYTTANDGWQPSGETWTYVSATTFTITGDKTTKYQIGDKLKLTQTTAKYFHIAKVAYSDPSTTITVVTQTDYTLANAAITSPYFSKVDSPQGFPDVFAYTPTISSSGWGTATTITGFYAMNGRRLSAWGKFTLGTAAAAVGTITMPDGFIFDTSKFTTGDFYQFGLIQRFGGVSAALWPARTAVLIQSGSNTNTLTMAYSAESNTYTPSNVSGSFVTGDVVTWRVADLPVASA